MFIKKIFGVMLLAAMLVLPQNVSAEKTDWFDRGYNFHNIRTIIVFDATFSQNRGYDDSITLRNLQDSFISEANKLRCNVITESEARRMLSYQIGVNLDSLAYSNPLEARRLIMQNAYRIADAWITGNVDNLDNTYYIEPSRTVWESKRETHTYYDRWGNRRQETRYIQVPVTYPPRRVDVSTLQVTLQVYDARNHNMIFARKDVRDREDYQAQKGMFGRICNSFFEDFAKKLR